MVLFDLDGTLVDSAPGIVAALQYALRRVGIEPPDESVLRSDLGPPPAVIFTRVGVPAELIEPARDAYRLYYWTHGMQQAEVYPGVRELLHELHERYRLATATMKKISTATEFLRLHELADVFDVVGGAGEEADGDKTSIIEATCLALGDPDRRRAVMVGDRHSDITGGQGAGLATIAITWGYGSREELTTAGPDVLVDRPDQLVPAIDRLLSEI